MPVAEQRGSADPRLEFTRIDLLGKIDEVLKQVKFQLEEDQL